MQLTLSEIAGMIGADAPQHPDERVFGYSIDSRTIQRGELFFAVKGQKLDGHQYVAAALHRGATAAVVSANRAAGYPTELQSKLLSAPDPLAALQALAAAVRKRWGGPLVAITGSAGKTPTKQMASTLLDRKSTR